MPDCSTRCTASRTTLSMSMSFAASSCTRRRSASGTFSLRRFVFSGSNPPSISFRFISISSMPTFEMMPKGITFSFCSSSTMPLVEFAFPELLAELLAGVLVLFLLLGAGLVESRGVPEGRQEQVEQPLLGKGRRLFLDLLGHLVLDHVDADLGEVPDDGVHVAAHIADFGELGCLDLEEGSLDQPAPGGVQPRSCPRPWGRS